MTELIKNIYNPQSLRKLAIDLQGVYEPFQVEAFLQSTMDETWYNLALKERIHKISTNLGTYLPSNYREAIAIIDKVVMNYGVWLEGWCGFFPTFVELYGQDEADWDISMRALERYTVYASSEFAVRAFIINDEERMMAQMYAWSKHEHECVRRLACEGCRPALPWASALTKFKKDPTPILPILEQLNRDPSIHVRKSVANNLNDISKTHPDLVIQIAKDWYGKHEYTDWIVKHGCRTLLKKGNTDVLSMFEYNSSSSVDMAGFVLNRSSISLGEDITFTFVISVKETTKVRLEYGIDYVKANGKRN